MFKPKTTISGRFGNSSGEWIRTTDLRVMRDNPEPVPIVRRALHFTWPAILGFLLARHAAIGDRCSYSMAFRWESQVAFEHQYQ
jgi:hypothetical protein